MTGMNGSNPVSMLQKIKRQQLRITGLVQGVGFRPFIYRLAQEFGLTGWVKNDGEGVLLEIQGINCEAFSSALYKQRPALSRIDQIKVKTVTPVSLEEVFLIKESQGGEVVCDIPADIATCPDCLAEMRDPLDRRYGYAFINCTHCGPRYSITKSLPYDRAQTTMAGFDMCPTCEQEYHDPLNRRFHAQPTCCPDCGPSLSHTITEIAHYIREGKILAIKGLGGFHLVCDALNANTVQLLRERKQRAAKPFAIMVAHPEQAEFFAHISPDERRLLEGAARPVVLLKKINDSLPETIAPNLNHIGVMLPYTPIQHLLLDELGARPLVMTSANPGGEPLVIGNDEAKARLAGIADIIIDHDRDILIRVDDSVVRQDGNKTTFLRRARGYTPCPITLKTEGPSVLALGAYLKNTICVTRGKQAYLSQHIGDLDRATTRAFLDETIDHLCGILQVKPQLVACDLHPDFATTHKAMDMDLPIFQIQHHHAHIASVVAEHHLKGPVIGVALDGFGLGNHGESWGGEMLRVDGLDMARIGHFTPLAQPGGDKAAVEPWRMGASVLHQLGRADEIETRYPDKDAKTLMLMLDKGLNAPRTSSAGRLFDAACGLLDICETSQFEGHAPMMLESLVSKIDIDPEGWNIHEDNLNLLPLLDKVSYLNAQSGANLFHGTLIAALADWIEKACAREKITTVALSGGCFLNQILSQGLIRKLQKAGLDAYLNQQAPLSDAGLSLGQAYLAQLYLEREN